MARKEIGSVWDRTNRNAINDNFEELYGYKNTADSAKEAADYAVNTAEYAKAKAESVQAQFNQVVIEGDSSVEAAQARVGSDGTTYETLKERLDTEYNEVNDRLTQARVDAEGKTYPTLKARLDAKETEFSSQLAQKASFQDLTFTDTTNSLGVSNQKIFCRETNDKFIVVSKKPSKKGYTYMHFLRNSGTPSDASNYGVNHELLRLVGVYDVTKALVYKRPETYTSSQAHTPGVDDFQPQNFATDYNSPGTITFLTNNLREAGTNEFLEFDVNIKKAHNGILHLGFLGTSGSVKNLEIYVNNTLVRSNVNISDSGKIKVISVNVSDFFGTVKIRLQFPSSPDGLVMHFLGYNVHDLAEADPNLTYSNGAYTVGSGTHYISVSQGANDYALKEFGGKWMGSFHGGETSLALSIKIDGVEGSTIPVGGFLIGKKVEINQTTDIIGKIKAHSTTKIYYDSVFEFECYFDVTNHFDVSDFYIAMTCSNPTFSNVIFPLKKSVTTGENYLPNVLKVVQENPTTNYQITTLITPAIGYKATNPLYILLNNSYSKVYHGKVINSRETLDDIGFASVKIFD